MEQNKPVENLIHPIVQEPPKDRMSYKRFFIGLVLMVAVGVGVGFIAASVGRKAGSPAQQVSSEKAVKTIGIADKKTFKDKAEGILREGGVDGEGNFHLERPGGASQNVYLTSTTVDLSQHIGKKVRVWGETFQAEKAGWLMDVGLVEVLP